VFKGAQGEPHLYSGSYKILKALFNKEAISVTIKIMRFLEQ
jgi:hypothetical protein